VAWVARLVANSLANEFATQPHDAPLGDKHYKSTALGWARYLDRPALVEVLEPPVRGI